MDVDTKYKRWGWGALIGLIAVILIAGLIVAISLSSPKKAELANSGNDGDSALIADDSDKDSDKKADESKDTADDSKKSDDSKKTEDSNKSEDSKKTEGSNKSEDKKTDSNKNSASGSTGTNGNKNANGGSATNSGNTGSNSGSSNASAMPKTGPAEDLMSVVALATIAGLAAHNVMLIKKRA